jgi:hypothetical protein
MSIDASGICRIGCGSGFWGDSPDGARQMVEAGVDFLVLDYLAEITMGLLAGARRRDASAGFVPDFIDYVIAPHARAIAQKQIKIVANAGGMNPDGCRVAVAQALEAAGVDLKIAVVTGDDLLVRHTSLRAAGVALPDNLVSLNAYLGARGIAEALDLGADIVITGRCVDSALVLGPLVHKFQWSWTNYDLMAQGSLAGHLVECGCQATGGILTDWRDSPGWERMGYPIAECFADGTFVLTKPAGTGGCVNRASAAEQLVYEVGDPAAYALPDVICDWREVRIEYLGPDRVRVSGAKGAPPTGLYKVSAVVTDGFRISGELTIAGRDAAEKAQRTGEAILVRTCAFMREAGFQDYAETLIEVIGAETLYGANSHARNTREVVLKVAARHAERAALDIFSREFLASATSMAQGITGFAGGRPKARPVLKHIGIIIDGEHVAERVEVNGIEKSVAGLRARQRIRPSPGKRGEQEDFLAGPTRQVPLIALAFGRSGDKGDTANIGIISRRYEFFPVLRRELTEAAVARYFAHLAKGPVHRYDWPGLDGLNFVLEAALGGGGTASLRQDPQGKTYAQLLMDFPVHVPEDWFLPGAMLSSWSCCAEH